MQRLPGDPRDDVEVAVVMQQRRPVQFRRRGDRQVRWSRAAVLAPAGQLALDLPGPGERTVVYSSSVIGQIAIRPAAAA